MSESQTESSGDLHPGAGFRVSPAVDRPSADVVSGLGAFPTADVSDRLNRMYTMQMAIRLMTPGTPHLAGPATTVKVFPGDNLMAHKALDVSRPGDVVVIDASGSTMTAVIGDMIATKARHRGIAGFVVDGLVRDVDGIIELGDIPVFARGVTPIGPLHRGPGEINQPVSCGGIVVRSGDVVLGDRDGVVVVQREVAPGLLRELQDGAPGKRAYEARVRQGEFSMAWVDETLRAGGIRSLQPGSPPDPTP